MAEVEIDLDAIHPIKTEAVETEIEVEKPSVVAVPFKDGEIRVNRDIIKYHKDTPVKLTRDQARIFIEANEGYIKQ